MIRTGSKQIKFVRYWSRYHNNMMYAYVGDRVIIMTRDKVFSGELARIGTKYLEVKCKPSDHYGKTTYFHHTKVFIGDVLNLVMYPKGHQKLTTKCHTKNGVNYHESNIN